MGWFPQDGSSFHSLNTSARWLTELALVVEVRWDVMVVDAMENAASLDADWNDEPG